MSVTAGSDLYAFRKKGIILDYRAGSRFILWLECGHSGGTAKAGTMVSKRHCPACGNSFKNIVRVEPVK